MIRLALALRASAILFGAIAQTHDLSRYAGLESCEIKSLSEIGLGDRRAGRGWSFALAAELKGVPGAAHLLGCC